MTLNEYRNKSKHLPKEFRDFHDQKDLFKQIGSMTDLNTQEVKVNWVDGMCYTIDYFLWIMAKYGYELRKVRNGPKREDINEAIKRRRQAEAEQFRSYRDESKRLCEAGTQSKQEVVGELANREANQTQ